MQAIIGSSYIVGIHCPHARRKQAWQGRNHWKHARKDEVEMVTDLNEK